MGSYVEAFLDLQRLSRVASSWPGLLQLMEEAATLSLAHRSKLRGSAVRAAPLLLAILPPQALNLIKLLIHAGLLGACMMTLGSSITSGDNARTGSHGAKFIEGAPSLDGCKIMRS